MSIKALSAGVANGFPVVLLANFDSGVLAAQADQGIPDGFTGSGTYTQYSNVKAFSGSQSGECSARQGRSDFNFLGGIVNLVGAGNRNIVEGETLYIGVKTYFPVGFDFMTDSGHLKFLRSTIRLADGTAVGRHDLFIANDRLGYKYGREDTFGSTVLFANAVSGNEAKTGEWEEVVLEIRATSVTDGNPIVKFYKLIGGSLVAEKRVGGTWTELYSNTTTPSLNDTGGYLDDFMFFTYWNGAGNAGAKLWISTLSNTFTVGNVIKGNTSLSEGTIDVLGVTSGENIEIASIGVREPPEFTIGEIITEYDPTGVTPTGVISTISVMYPNKNQKFYVDDILVSTVRPAELP